MKAVILGVICAACLAFTASVVLKDNQINASQAFTTEGVRLSEH